MHKYDDEIKKFLLPNENVEKIYEQSESYIYENPFNSFLNWVYFAVVLINTVVVLWLAYTGFTRYYAYEMSLIGAVFFCVNCVLFCYSLSASGNNIRGLKVGNFKYGYDYAHLNKNGDFTDEQVNLRSHYSIYFILMSFFCGFALHFYGVSMRGVPGLTIILMYVFGLTFMPIMVLNMLWRRSRRKIAILTDQRLIIYNLKSKKADYIYVGPWLEITSAVNYYTIYIRDMDLLSKMSFLEAARELIDMRVNHEHTYLEVHGMKHFEDLYRRLLRKARN